MSDPGTLMSERSRFWAKVEKTDGCWYWRSTERPKGYGSFWVGGRAGRYVGAHRYAYELAHGPIPDGLCIDHLCRETKCVNPNHMEVVTRWENVRRGRNHVAENVRKKACRYGHPFDEANTYVDGRGKRQCRICNARRQREYLARKQAA